MDSETLRRAARQYAPIALVVGLLAVVAFVTATSRLHVRALPRSSGTPRNVAPTLPPMPSSTPIAGLPTAPGHTPAGVSIVLRILFVLVCLGVVALIVLLALRVARRSVRTRTARSGAGEEMPPISGRATAEVLEAAVAAGLVELADESDPRGAVINAWVRLEQAAAQIGIARGPADTPADLATRLLVEHAVAADVLARLTDLYRTARYSPRTVDDRMRIDALDALNAISASLHQPAANL